MPGLQQLLGEMTQLLRISRGIDRAAEALDLELLANGEFNTTREIGMHEPHRSGLKQRNHLMRLTRNNGNQPSR